jgi:YbgC/YbaW family acyl-CoA thioester hydrolase
MLQHVNNAVYLSYFEEARIHYFRQLVGIHWDWNKTGILLRKNELEYIKPVFLHDPVEIAVYLKHLGDKSFNVSRAVSGSTRSWQTILKEISKCDIVCANCHRIRTQERGNYKRNQAFVTQRTE